jgi:hypothetical protein
MNEESISQKGKSSMQIQFIMQGGIAYIPRLREPMMLESDQLPVQEAEELKRLVKATDFFQLPTVVGAPSPGAADYYRYTITIQDEGKHHTVQLIEPVKDPNLQALLSYLRARRSAAR